MARVEEATVEAVTLSLTEPEAEFLRTLTGHLAGEHSGSIFNALWGVGVNETTEAEIEVQAEISRLIEPPF